MKRRLFLGVYILLILARIFSIFFFVKWPLITWIVVYLLDVFDCPFAIWGGIKFSGYQKIDKTVDFITRLYLVYTAWILGWPYLIFLGLVIIRLVGDLLYLFSGKEKYMFYFPNLVEFFFPAYFFYNKYLIFENNSLVYLIILALLSAILKTINEYYLHVKLDIGKKLRAYYLKIIKT